MPFVKGQKPPGRLPGTPTRRTVEFRSTVTQLLEANSKNVARWLALVAEGDQQNGIRPDPGKALDLITRLAEFAAPKLARTEVVGENGGAIKIQRIERVVIDHEVISKVPERVDMRLVANDDSSSV